MCGRFVITKPEEEVRKRYRLKTIEGQYRKRWNAAPSQNLAVITNHTPDALQFFRWGLLPGWAKEAKFQANTINARAESVAEKPTFQHAYKRQRCLVIADGYYEWKLVGKEKLPYHLKLKDHRLFAMAGLWEYWEQPGHAPIWSFTIITLPAAGRIAHIHDRMPAILSPLGEQVWLSEEATEAELENAIWQHAAKDLSAYTVSKRIGNVKLDGPDLIEPVQYQVQGSLF